MKKRGLIFTIFAVMKNGRDEMSLVIPPQALAATNQATKPQYNVWVSANAGSGKTHVLTLRVIRLLLSGVEPSKILCLTYTKAAANVMKIRIFERLAQWATLPDAELAAEIMAIEGREASAAELCLARQLFARAQDTPGGLKLQTIHAFCELLLHQFCLEADMPYHFRLMDKAQTKFCRSQAKLAVMQAASLQGRSDSALALRYLLLELGEDSLNKLFEEAAEHANELRPALRQARQLGVRAFLQKSLDIDYSEADLLRQIAQFGADAQLRQALDASSYELAQNLADQLQQLEQARDLAAKLDILYGMFFTKVGSARSFSRLPLALREAVEAMLPSATKCIMQWRGLKLLELNKAIYMVIAEFLANYRQIKHQHAWIEFSDLLYRTDFLLRRQNLASWVHYKLDNAIDHILLDEAQDTSPVQWRIIQALMAEFYAGAGQKEVQRSSFAVGDEKQSIYSFQGAAPLDFAKNGALIQAKSRLSEKPFNNVELLYSFRSTKPILAAVDKIFSFSENYTGLTAAGGPTQHRAVRSDEYGYVEIWENLQCEPKSAEDLSQSVLEASRLSELIANHIARLLSEGRATAGDIIILVRNRVGPFCNYMLRALKNRKIEVAGIDKLELNDHIAISDLCALGRFVLQSRDDLALACLFKSPLFNLSEQDLFAVSQRKIAQNSTLWQALQAEAKASGRLDLQRAVKLLRKYQVLAYSLAPFEFYSHVLTIDEGRQNIIARLGPEASEVLDEFLRLSLLMQSEAAPGLQNFLAKFEQQKIELKRNFAANNQVRILTVHGAKGLEAPIVFLVDIAGGNNSNKAGFKTLPNGASIWYQRDEYQTESLKLLLAQEESEAAKEHRRLLYVALTRAKEYLFLCGSGEPASQRWHTMVSEALLPEAHSLPPLQLGQIQLAAWRFGTEPRAKKLEATPMPTAVPSLDISKKLAILRQKLDVSTFTPPRPLMASDAMFFIEPEPVELKGGEQLSPIVFTSSPDLQADKRQLGLLAHSLLQYLPQIEPLKRWQLASALLQSSRPALSEQQQDYVMKSVFALLEDANLQDLFGEQSAAEVDLAGKLSLNGNEYNVSGRIDRMVIKPDYIMFADYKTGRAVDEAEQIAREHLVQMALYYKLLANIYNQEIRALLIYTKNLKYFELDKDILYNSLAQHLEKRI